MSEDLISREKAYKVLSEYYHHKTEMQHKALREALNRVPSAELQPTCNKLATDCIRRGDAIDALWKLRRSQQMLDDTQTADMVMQGIFLSEQKIKNLPSADIDLSGYSDRLWRKAYEQGKADAEVERKKGKWVQDGKGFYECTSCGEAWSHWWAVMVPPDRMYKELRFCPKCGAEMKGVSDE